MLRIWYHMVYNLCRRYILKRLQLSRFIFNKNKDILVKTDSEDNVASRFARVYEIVAADIRNFVENAISPTNSNLSARYYYSVDEQGSSDFITDIAGNVRNEYWYDAFGNVLNNKQEVYNRITYTGQQFDNITQQYYLRARFYNPVIGRFTQDDVYRGDGLNLYAYCGNNPIRYFDCSGYSRCPKSKQIQHNTNVTNSSTKGVSWIAPNSLPFEEEQSLLNTLKYIDSNTKPSGNLAKRWGINFGNYQGYLPNGKYKEYRVSPPVGTRNDGPRRIVKNVNTGELYYTWTHYGDAGNPAFVRIR